MTTLTDTQVITASGGLVELGYSRITSNVQITSATGGSGTPIIPAMTVVCDGSPVLIEFFSESLVVANNQINISLYRDGSEVVRYWTQGANPDAANSAFPFIYGQYRDSPSAGSHTYEIKAFNTSGTGNYIYAANTTTGNAPAFLRVSKIVQATQWPAVTTGTIICTSSTRPASPFEGQTIYETDTDRTLTYNNTAWVSPSTTFRPPMCRVYRAAALSHTGTGTFQTIAFDTESFTQTESGMWSSGTPTRVTPQTAGVYLVTANVNFNTNATGVRGLGLYKNGTVNPFAYQDAAGSASLSNGLFLSGTVNLSVGDYVQPLAFQNSGGNLAYVAGNGEQVSFSVTWMGKP